MAYMLSKAGHKVRVLEKLPDIGTSAAGLRVPPNMSKILKKWVGEEELRKTAVRNLASPWWDCKWYIYYSVGRTPNVLGSPITSVLCLIFFNLSCTVHAGECFGVAQWRLDVMSETGGDFLMMAVRSILSVSASARADID